MRDSEVNDDVDMDGEDVSSSTESDLSDRAAAARSINSDTGFVSLDTGLYTIHLRLTHSGHVKYYQPGSM